MAKGARATKGGGGGGGGGGAQGQGTGTQTKTEGGGGGGGGAGGGARNHKQGGGGGGGRNRKHNKEVILEAYFYFNGNVRRCFGLLPHDAMSRCRATKRALNNASFELFCHLELQLKRK
jgi:hypothetical protein